LSITLTLPQGATVGATQIRFIYSVSDPALLTRTGTGTRADPYLYHPDPTGTLRIWAKPESYVRNAASIASGGDYLPNNQTFNASALTWSNGVADLYVEAVSPSLSVGGNSISVQVVPSGGPTYSDYVRYTAISTTVAVDANRSGGINFDGSDLTTPAAPYRFWLNDSTSQMTGSAGSPQYDTVIGGTPDFTRHAIVNQGDLQNFAPLEVQLPLGSSDGNGNLKPGWSAFVQYAPTSGSPSIDLYDLQSTYATNFLTYLTDPTTGSAIGDPRAHSGTGLSASAIVGNTLEYLPIAAGQEDANHDLHFLFGGDTAGSGWLSVEFRYNGHVVASDSMNLTLAPITQMYEQASVISSNWVDSSGKVTLTDPTMIAPTAAITNPYTDSSPEDNKYVVFVHGWRMKTNEMEAYADTMFKRLYWQGYTGRFVAFKWPTEWVNTDSNWALIKDPGNFDQSEENAWYSAPALAQLLLTLDQQSGGYQNVNLLAHSMGNVVASEALRLATTEGFAPIPNVQPVVNSYIASQAAIPAEAFDATVSKNLQAQADITISKLVWYKDVFARAAQSGPTADVYQNYPGRVGYVSGNEVPLFYTLNKGATSLWNFYNPNDYALTQWEINEVLKPDLGYAYTGPLNSNGDIIPGTDPGAPGFSSPGEHERITLSYQSNMYQLLAFAAQPRSLALGMVNTGGVFGKNDVNLQTDDAFTGAPADHSGEFNGMESQRILYWQAVVKDMGVSHW
jgi:pimeloyl-ACP methyl ester carboxylesterase